MTCQKERRRERERPRCRDVAKDDWRCVDADGREGNKEGREERERGWNCMAFAEQAPLPLITISYTCDYGAAATSEEETILFLAHMHIFAGLDIFCYILPNLSIQFGFEHWRL